MTHNLTGERSIFSGHAVRMLRTTLAPTGQKRVIKHRLRHAIGSAQSAGGQAHRMIRVTGQSRLKKRHIEMRDHRGDSGINRMGPCEGCRALGTSLVA